jgi:DNA-binding transcriptional MerR regulator
LINISHGERMAEFEGSGTRLGVSAATLYAYVSRGLLRSEASDGRRERRYRADDIAR